MLADLQHTEVTTRVRAQSKTGPWVTGVWMYGNKSVAKSYLKTESSDCF